MKSRRFRVPLIGLAVVASALVAYLAWQTWLGPSDHNDDYVYYTLTRTDLPIVITERGNLESQQETTIRCQVESRGYDNRSGNSGTQIIFIVPNGSAVKEGELLVELDSAPIRDSLNEQEIVVERAKAEFIQAEAQYKNQIEQSKTNLADAELQVNLAKLELEMFQDEENGTHRVNEDEIKRQIDETNNRILEAEAALELKKNELDGIEQLYKLGYKGENDLEQVRLSYLQAEGSLAAAINQLDSQQAMLNKLNAYEKRMELLRLQGALDNAVRAHAQVEIDNKSQETQAKAALDAAQRALTKEEEQLKQYQDQLRFCTIYAPHDGMVVYERDRDFTVEEGAFVRERQEILSLPNLSLMQVETEVHESVLEQVDVGQRATVRIDAFPDRTYDAVVESVAVVPDYQGRWSSDVKAYETIIRLVDEVQQLKPGMTAVVKIHVDRLEDVLAVPVQAIVQRERDTWCYVANGSSYETRPLSLGRTNDKFVHVQNGLAEGDRIILNPMAILDREAKPNSAKPGEEEAGDADGSGESESEGGDTTDDPSGIAEKRSSDGQRSSDGPGVMASTSP